MADTYSGTCKRCGEETDVIYSLCLECSLAENEEDSRSFSEHYNDIK